MKIFLIMIASSFISAISQIALANDDSYIDCLKKSFEGSHSFSAEDVRSLCQEISGTQDASYKLENGAMIPTNEYTKCYDRQKKELSALSAKRAAEIAAMICRYEAR